MKERNNAWQDVLSRYYQDEYRKMLTFGYTYLENRSLAEVAIQETFLLATEKQAVLMAHPNPKGWLYTTLRHVVQQMGRDKQRAMKLCVDLDHTADPGYEMDLPSELDNMDSDDLLLIKAIYLDGVPLKEYAESCGISVSTLRMRLSRLKKRLREDPTIKEIKNFKE